MLPNELASLHGTEFVHGALVKLAGVAPALRGHCDIDQCASYLGAQGIGRFRYLQSAASPQKDVTQYFDNSRIEIELFREFCNFFRDCWTHLFQWGFPTHATPRR